MQLNDLKLLQALGTTIPYKSKPVNKYDCPLHKDGEQTLRIGKARPGGMSHFECTHQSCRFSGDGISLACAVLNVGPSDVLTMLRPGGRLAHVMDEPIKPYEAEEYVESRMMQDEVKSYLTACQRSLRSSPEKCGIRAGLSRNSLRLIPRETCLLSDAESAPAVFRKFARPKYAKSTYVAYPFTYNGDIMHVKVQDVAASDSFETAVVARADVGVFMDGFDAVPKSILCVFDPRDAAIIYGNCMAETTLKPPVVGIAGFPLPDNFAGVGHIYILATANKPIPLEQCFMLLEREEVVAGAGRQPLIKVWSTSCGAEDITAEMVRRKLDNPNGYTVKLDLWTIMEIDRMVIAGKHDHVAVALATSGMSEVVRRGLLALAKAHKACKGAIEVLASTIPVNPSTLALGNGKTFRRGATWIKATKGINATTLCNVGIDVLHKIRAYSGDEIVVCNVMPEDTGVPAVKMNIPVKAWMSAQTLQAAVTSGFSARGHSPYVAFYTVSGYAWHDIMCKLSERCPIQREVPSLGLDELSDLHLPEFTYRTSTKSIERQNQIFTIPAETMQTYSGIPFGKTISNLEPFRRLMSNCDNLYIAAFTVGLMHTIFQMTYSMYKSSSAVRQAMRHLLYVETETGIWQSVFRQLATFFSNSDFVPTLSYADPGSTLMKYRQLGTLPLVATVPGMRGDKLAHAIADSGVCLIGLTDGLTATMANGHMSATYVTPSDDSAVDIRDCLIAHDDIESMRESFPGFLATFIAKANIDAAYRAARTPALAVYDICCEMLGVEKSPVVRRILKPCFPSLGMTGVNTFFDVLHALVYAPDTPNPMICIIHGKPEFCTNFADRGQHIILMEDCVIISQAIIPVINKESVNRFSAEQLTAELTERGLLRKRPDWANLDMQRFWVLDRATWETEVARPPMPITDESGHDKTIQLSIYN